MPDKPKVSPAMRAYMRRVNTFTREQNAKLNAILHRPDPRAVRCENGGCNRMFQADLNNDSTCPHCGFVRAIRRR